MKSVSQTGHTLGPGAKQVPAPLRKTLAYFPPPPAPSAPPTQRASASAADCGCAARMRLRCLVTAGPRRCARASPVPVVASETWFRAPRTKPVEQPELGGKGCSAGPGGWNVSVYCRHSADASAVLGGAEAWATPQGVSSACSAFPVPGLCPQSWCNVPCSFRQNVCVGGSCFFAVPPSNVKLPQKEI